MADDDRAGLETGDEGFEPFEAVQVEIVGRLVQQEDVVAAEQQRGEAGAGRLAAGQGGHRLVEADGQAERSGHLVGPLVQVGAAEGEPALKAVGVGVVRSGRALHQALGGGVERPLRGVHPGAPGQEGPYGLARAALGLLRQVADGGGRRAEPQQALLGRVQAGQQP